MATIVTVHGTFASGPLEGQKWWQRSSPFTSKLKDWVEAEVGEVKIEPYVWDGKNSELARRSAGQGLAEKLDKLDADREPYVVIGHSHGGSVISAALLTMARNRQPLETMRRWITVGTPFIKTRRQRFLFSRLGVFGKAVYLTLLTFLVLGSLAMFVQADSRSLLGWLGALITFAGPITLFYVLLRYQESRRSLRFNPSVARFAESNFAGRWLSLWHGKDEAVQSLKAVKSLDVEIFSRNFAASALNLLAVGIVPLLCIIALNYEPVVDAIADKITIVFGAAPGDDIYGSGGKNIFENAVIVFIGMIVLPASIAFPNLDFLENLPLWQQIGLLIFSIALLLLSATFLTWIFNGLAHLISNGLSRVLNPITLSQLKSVAYGSDAREDLAVDASEWPVWMKRGFPPLPAMISEPIEQSSDVAIGNAIPKFRNVIESLTAAETPQATSDILADYLTWNELIHTSYFADERFAKLMAFAICQCEGFKPTEQFAQDPEFHDIARSYGEIVLRAVDQEVSANVPM